MTPSTFTLIVSGHARVPYRYFLRRIVVVLVCIGVATLPQCASGNVQQLCGSQESDTQAGTDRKRRRSSVPDILRRWRDWEIQLKPRLSQELGTTLMIRECDACCTLDLHRGTHYLPTAPVLVGRELRNLTKRPVTITLRAT
ncbi:hypothetical protein F5Y15DRAFT_129538 [Xylariaceae sp. FL0016]|nr:hypothetical protein F5Y15DRAFT_129538 [Xylariaceae sp. FL0016]